MRRVRFGNEYLSLNNGEGEGVISLVTNILNIIDYFPNQLEIFHALDAMKMHMKYCPTIVYVCKLFFF